jgi:hypothetical protein
MASKRKALIAAFVDRLETISSATEGFVTDAGAAVHVNYVPTLGEHDPPVSLALLVRTGNPPSWQKKKAFVDLLLTVIVLIKEPSEDAWMLLEDARADVIVAIEGPTDWTFGGLVTPELERAGEDVQARPSGNAAMSASLTFKVQYQEQRGNPNL